MSYKKEVIPPSASFSFPIEIWIPWCAATVVASIMAMVFFYSHFQTKESFDEYQNMLDKRLVRMEDKLDKILEKRD